MRWRSNLPQGMSRSKWDLFCILVSDSFVVLYLVHIKPLCGLYPTFSYKYPTLWNFSHSVKFPRIPYCIPNRRNGIFKFYFLFCCIILFLLSVSHFTARTRKWERWNFLQFFSQLANFSNSDLIGLFQIFNSHLC